MPKKIKQKKQKKAKMQNSWVRTWLGEMWRWIKANNI